MYKVLIVEDEVLVRVGLKTTIDWEAIGFTIISEASNGEQGYESYQKYKPDVIITDIRMPKQDGLWLVENIRRDDSDTKILVLTCYDEFSYVRRALKLGADDYILKSEVEDEELIKLMNSMKQKLDQQNKEKEWKEVGLSDREQHRKAVIAELIKERFVMNDRRIIGLQDLEFPIVDSAFAFLGLKMVQNFADQKDMTQVRDAVMNILYEQLKHSNITYLEDQYSNMHLLFLSSTKLNAVEMKRILTFVSNGAKQYFDISVNIIYTKVFTQLDMSGRLFKEFALKAQIFFYRLQDKNTLWQIEVINFMEPNVFELKKIYNNNFIDAIGHENNERVMEILVELDEYFEKNLVSPMTVKIFYSNLMGDLFDNYGFFLTNKDIFETHEMYHDLIIHVEYLSEIDRILKEFSESLIGEIKEMRHNNSKFMINQVLNFIEQHYTEDISLEDVAKEMNLSKNYLCSVFKKETGDNMSLYINKIRIEQAKKMLLESDKKIKEIFEKVGYSNQQYFSKMFKKITGMTVIEYKESLGKK